MPSVAPFKQHCVKCSLSNVIIIDGGFYCNHCHSVREVIKKAHLSAKIVNDEGEILITIEGQWLVSLVRMSEEQFLALSRGQQIKMLSTLKVKGGFLLTSLAVLCGYEEQMEASGSDSNVDTNITDEDNHLFQTPTKRRLDDDDANAGAGSAKKIVK